MLELNTLLDFTKFIVKMPKQYCLQYQVYTRIYFADNAYTHVSNK